MSEEEKSPVRGSRGLEKLQPRALRVRVAEVLRQALIEGRYAPGSDLADTVLAKELNVSRGPVREALLLLAADGLIVHSHYRGFQVPVLQARDIRQITRARLPLETLSLELAREHATPGDIRELRVLKDELLEAVKRGDPEEDPPSHRDFAFHRRVWELAGDPWLLTGLCRICTTRFMFVSARDMGFEPPPLEAMDRMHQCYIDYISGATEQSAHECVALHLNLTDS